jgi:hypothetical protein
VLSEPIRHCAYPQAALETVTHPKEIALRCRSDSEAFRRARK